MMKLSKNKKTNAVLMDILLDLLTLDNYGEYEEVKRYRRRYANFLDFNLYSYGNCRIYNDEIIDLYKEFKSLKNASIERLIDIYKRQIRYVARFYLRNRDELLKAYKEGRL